MFISQLRPFLTKLGLCQHALIARATWHLGACQSTLRIALENLFRPDGPPKFGLAFALGAPATPWEQLQQRNEQQKDSLGPLATLLEPILRAASKKMKSPYVKRREWHTLGENTNRKKYGMPLLKTTHCLECGNLTLPSCVCPHCYSKIREKTDELKSMLGGDFKFRHPAKEVKFVYENEHFGIENSKHVVKLEGQRPGWFSKAVLPKRKQ